MTFTFVSSMDEVLRLTLLPVASPVLADKQAQRVPEITAADGTRVQATTPAL
jgi:hypothetical protein